MGLKPRSRSKAYKNINFIKLLTDHKHNTKQLKTLLKHCTNQEIDGITEIIHNFLRGHLKCNKNKYKKQANLLRTIGDSSKSNSLRRKTLIRKGAGIVAPLLAIAVPALIELFGRDRKK